MSADIIDALRSSLLGLKVVRSDLVGPGQAFLFRDPVPLMFEIAEPVFERRRDFPGVGMYACYSMPTPVAFLMTACDIGPEPRWHRWHKWHWKYRGPRRRSRRLPSNAKVCGPAPLSPTTQKPIVAGSVSTDLLGHSAQEK